MKRNMLLLIVTFTLLSCSQGQQKISDPLMGLQIGEPNKSWIKKVNTLVRENAIYKPHHNYDHYTYSFVNNGDTIRAAVEFNYKDDQNCQLNNVRFDFRADKELDDGEVLPLFAARNSKEVDKVLEWFVSYYGWPDDTIPNEGNILDIYIGIEQLHQFLHYPDAYIWNFPNYSIEFYHGNRDVYRGNPRSKPNHYKTAYIFYRINNYREIYQSTK